MQGVVVRVRDPLINVTVHCDPPKPELHINMLDIVNPDNHTTAVLADGSKVIEAKSVKRSLHQYGLFKKKSHERQSILSSPESIRSQDGRSPIHGRAISTEDDIPVSQLQFCTQVHGAPQRERHIAPTTVIPTDNTALLEMLKGQKPLEKGAVSNDTLFVSQVQPPHGVAENSDVSSIDVENQEVKISTASEIPPKAATPVVAAAGNNRSSTQTDIEERHQVGEQQVAPKHKVTGTIDEHGRSSAQTENKGSQQVDEQQVATKHKVPRTLATPHELPPKGPATTATRPGQNVSSAVSNEPLQPFQRFRKEGPAGKHVPSYFSIIPRDQKELLISDDSWQPPLVGRPARPGQVPTSLLQRLTDAADYPKEAAVEPDALPSSHGNEREPITDNSGNQDGLAEGEGEEDSSQLDGSSISWSQSPPTQHRRKQLPPNSPPLLLHHRNPIHSPENPRSQQVNEPDSPKVRLPTATTTFARAQIEAATSGFRRSSRARDVLDNSGEPLPAEAGDVCQNSQIRFTGLPIPQPLSGVENEEVNAEHAGAQSFFSTDSKSANSPKGVQVNRTPYVGKGPNENHFRSALPRDGSPRVFQNRTQPISSCLVPGTFDESPPASGLQTKQATSVATTGQEHTKKSKLNDASDPDVALESQPQQLRAQSSPKSLADRITASNNGYPTTARRDEQVSCDIYAKSSEMFNILDGPDDPIGTTVAPHPNLIAGFSGNESAQGTAVPRMPLDVQQPSRTSTSSSPSMVVSQRGSAMHSITTSETRQSQSKRKQADVEDMGGPSKRRQTDGCENVLDKDYAPLVERLKDFRRETLSPLSKSKVSKVQAVSSSPQDSSIVSEVPFTRALPKGERIMTPRSAGGSQTSSSTPITRISTYDDKAAGANWQRVSNSGTSGSSACDPESLFPKFQEAYPDYKGSVKDFTRSCNVLSKILSLGQALHPFLFDDAIFHHYHSYRPYLADEALHAAAPLSFFDFYNERIEDPSHSKKVVTKSALHSILERPQAANLAISIRQRHLSHSSPSPMVPGASSRISKSRVAANHTPALRRDVCDVDTPELPENAVEKWRRQASSAASPELGTPDVDRRLSDIPPLEISADDNQTPATRSSMGPPQASKKRSRFSDPNPRNSNEGKRSRTSFPSTSHSSKRPKLSASPFVKPAKPTPVKAETPTRETPPTAAVVEMPPEWWTESDTPFKRYVDGYSKLNSHRNELGTVNIGAQNQNLGGVDPFSWRR